MPSLDPRPLLALGGLLVALTWSSAHAQDKAAGLFDDEKPAATKDKEKDPAKDQAKAEIKDAGKPAPGSAADRDVIGFTQENATGQMTELEERMYRLSEALRGLEPENASRLRLALKFSKEESILEQMRETHKLLKDTQLNRAEVEVKELLAKLEHLRDVLLAEDLDFQLKLARLRQIRETLTQLDRIVKEEQRALGWSRFAVDQRQAKARLTAVKPDLEALGRDAIALLTDSRATTKDSPGADRQGIKNRVSSLGKAVAALAANPLFADFQPSELRKADAQIGAAVAKFDDDLAAAVQAEEQAETVLRSELKSLDTRISEADRDVADAEFRRHEADQIRNRQAAASLGASSARLGDVGVPLQKDLIRAGSAMETAEAKLGKSEPDTATTEQTAALEILVRSAEELGQAAEKLLVELRTELQNRLNNDLTAMNETQLSIRETAEAQVPRLAQKSRSAAIAVTGLAQKEADMAGKMEYFVALVEETEYGIALPTTLRVFGREMRAIEGWLKEVDAGPRTINLAKRLEDDLLTVLSAIRRLSPRTPPPPGSALPSDLRERERELNRFIAELKLVRLLQARLNDDTVGIDKSRPNPSDLPPLIRREVEGLESNQEEIRDALARVAERIQAP